MSQVTVRAFDEARDAAGVSDLFERVNRELAPLPMAGDFERYIALARREGIDRLPAYYAGAGCGFWIGEDARGTLLGTYGLEPAGEDAVELRRMYVAPEARRRGIARTLLADAQERGRACGFPRMVLSTSEVQVAALALYREAGFTLMREELAEGATNKTVGGGLRRFHFEKGL